MIRLITAGLGAPRTVSTATCRAIKQSQQEEKRCGVQTEPQASFTLYEGKESCAIHNPPIPYQVLDMILGGKQGVARELGADIVQTEGNVMIAQSINDLRKDATGCMESRREESLL